MTAAEFFASYAVRSGVTEAWLAEHGRRVYRCDCGKEACEGWQMLSESAVEDDRRFGVALYVDPYDRGYAPGDAHSLSQPEA